MLRTVCVAALALACTGIAQSAGQHQPGAVPPGVIDTFPAVVRVHVVMEESDGGRLQKRRGSGSGVIIHRDGYVVTNHHVAGRATHIVCDLADHQEVPAELVGTDALADIAVLKIDVSKLRDPDRQLPTAQWGDSDAVRVGDPVFAMGSPAAISQSVTKGVVANTRMIMPKQGGRGMRLDGEDNGSVVRWLAHDAVIFGGNSGGPLVNSRGEIVGINEIGFANLSGAIPGNLARRVAALLIEHGVVPRSYSGIELQPRLCDSSHRGALVSSVAEDSPAARAGLRVGDRLLSLDEVRTDCRIEEDLPSIRSRLMSLVVGEAVEAVYVRAGAERRASIVLEAREPAQRRDREERSLGITYADITRSQMQRKGLRSRSGVLVRGVRPGAAAGHATPPVETDDVIVAVDRQPVADGAELLARLAQLEGDRCVLTVRRGRQELLVVVDRGERSERRAAVRPERAWIPIRTQVLTADLAEALGLKAAGGVRVTEVLVDATDDFPLQVGDIVTEIGGRAVAARRASDASAFRRAISRRRVGEEVALTIRRGSEKIAMNLKLGAPPPDAADVATFEELTLEFTCRDRVAMDDRDSVVRRTSGVIVTDAADGGWASLAGLRKGDRVLRFGDTTVGDVSDLSRAAKRLLTERPSRIVVLVARGHLTEFLRIEPVWN